MRRIHLFEFGDLSWFPNNLRNYGTDYIQFAANTFDIYKSVIPLIRKGIESSANNTIVDIASGGGGGLLKIAEHLKRDISNVKIILSDYYPNIDAFERIRFKQPDVFEYVKDPVNAMNVPRYLKGFRTQFLSLHHFKPKDAAEILQNALDNNQAIGIFEAQQRDIKNILKMLLSPIAVLLMTPFIKPFKVNRLIFTYLIPVLPLITLWDGVISVLRTYNEKELSQMILQLRNSERFNWQVGINKARQSDILYLIGIPRR